MGIYWQSVPTIQPNLWLSNSFGPIARTVPPSPGPGAADRHLWDGPVRSIISRI